MPKRILAADDSRTIRQVIAYTFQKEPEVELLLASSGQMALEILRKEAIDLLLLDYKMPDLNGITLSARLKQEPQLAHLPILLLVGRQFQRSQAAQSRANGIIRKPFTTVELIERTAGMLGFRYQPLPMSIEQEIRGATDSIEIDIDMGEFSGPGSSAALAAVTAPPPLPPHLPPGSALPTPPPQGRPPSRPPVGNPPPYPPPSFGSVPGIGAPVDDVIDDIPYSSSLPPDLNAPSSPTPPTGGLPKQGPPPFSPSKNRAIPGPDSSGPPPLLQSKRKKTSPAMITAERPYSAPLTPLPVEDLVPSSGQKPEELQVFVGQAVEAPKDKPKAKELMLPIDGPSDTENSPFPPLPPKPSLSAPEAQDSAKGSSPGIIDPFSTKPRDAQAGPPPNPGLPGTPKFPPRRPPSKQTEESASSPQATQKFRMMDLLADEDLVTASSLRHPGSTPVPVNDLLPFDDGPAKADSPLQNAFLQPSQVADSDGDTAVTLQAPLQEAASSAQEEESTPLIPMKAVNVSPPPINRNKASKDTLFETPSIESHEESEISVIKIETPEDEGAHTDFMGDEGEENPFESEEQGSTSVVVTPSLPSLDELCPAGHIRFHIGAPLALQELSVLLQLLQHVGTRAEKVAGPNSSQSLTLDSVRQEQQTILTIGGHPMQLRMLMPAFLACWLNTTEAHVEEVSQKLSEGLAEGEKKTYSRAQSRLQVDLSAIIQALKQELPMMQDTPLLSGTSGIDGPALLFQDAGTPTPSKQSQELKQRRTLAKSLRENLSLAQLDAMLEEAFSLSLQDIASFGFGAPIVVLAMVHHFAHREQLEDLIELIQELHPSIQV